MKTYPFEYSDQRYTARLIALSGIGFSAVVFTGGYTIPILTIGGMILFAFAVAIAIFWLNKKKIKQLGSAAITDSYVEFTLHQSTKKIEYARINKVRVQSFGSVRLTIRMIDGEKFVISANMNFCKPEQLLFVSQVIEKIITDIQKKN